MKKPTPKWHKEWDRTFKDLLKDCCVEGMGRIHLTFNDYAKQFIQGLLDEQRRDLYKRHNLLALSFEKISHLKCDKKRIKNLIEGNIKEAEKLKKELNELL